MTAEMGSSPPQQVEENGLMGILNMPFFMYRKNYLLMDLYSLNLIKLFYGETRCKKILTFKLLGSQSPLAQYMTQGLG